MQQCNTFSLFYEKSDWVKVSTFCTFVVTGRRARSKMRSSHTQAITRDTSYEMKAAHDASEEFYLLSALCAQKCDHL